MSADKPDAGDGTGSGKGGDVMSSLPRTRPQRPSRRRASGREGTAEAKRAPAKPAAARPKAAKPASRGSRTASQRRKPQGVRPSAATDAAAHAPPPKRPASPPTGTDLVGTAVQAAGEIAQLGLTLGTRALRDAVKRIPRP